MKDELIGLTEKEVSGTGSIRSKKILLNVFRFFFTVNNSSCGHINLLEWMKLYN